MCAHTHLSSRVAKGINLPANSGNVIKLLLEEPVPKRRVFDHADIMRTRLIVHRPPSVDKLQLSSLYQSAHHLQHAIHTGGGGLS